MITLKHNGELNTERIKWIYLYTPLCGTCQLARSFIELAEKAYGESFIYELDLNYFKNGAQLWGIESVPCLVKIAEGKPIKKLYAFESVSTVFEFISTH
ncbi:thioredoxin family protein [Salipaludibacillus agaradhaerens]|uniref:Thioredoxin family protein n=1 Tax=Salipaludibacillus agaradhaerens TaxID=76935 RepID=A0A9Q4B187_SALAG|nr:thioredoxin family protein [Salipaludibacillus agaradhaerens]MCR6096464.1 thioredoxin family protein [Salipaludibacillus agaradhaerens]MCR6113977.1 thioredoxin family protein [Salipaludibacillus agaradhaerens]